jgi:hypothetical protein
MPRASEEGGVIVIVAWARFGVDAMVDPCDLMGRVKHECVDIRSGVEA